MASKPRIIRDVCSHVRNLCWKPHRGSLVDVAPCRAESRGLSSLQQEHPPGRQRSAALGMTSSQYERRVTSLVWKNALVSWSCGRANSAFPGPWPAVSNPFGLSLCSAATCQEYIHVELSSPVSAPAAPRRQTDICRHRLEFVSSPLASRKHPPPALSYHFMPPPRRYTGA